MVSVLTIYKVVSVLNRSNFNSRKKGYLYTVYRIMFSYNAGHNLMLFNILLLVQLEFSSGSLIMLMPQSVSYTVYATLS